MVKPDQNLYTINCIFILQIANAFTTLEGGSRDNPCAPTYNGGEPFTEPESRALRDAILAESKRTKSYLTVHSYGQVNMSGISL